MNSVQPETETSSWPQVKRALARLVVLQLSLVATHGLTLWLHTMGAHAFHGNLAVGGIIFAVFLPLPQTVV